MRLTPDQVTQIHLATTCFFGEQAKVWLFGSRVDDQKKGGDIDLLIQANIVDAVEGMRLKSQLLATLDRQLGEQKIDVLLEMPNDERAIVQIAKQTGVLL
jgi:predicted nucleotidyltransferase